MVERENTLVDLAREHHPATVRNVYYRAVVAGIVTKDQRGYDKVQRSLLQLRRDGRIPYAWIVDNTRWMRKPQSWGSIEEALEHTANTYRRDLWRDTDQRVEVWCESDSIAGVLWDVTASWGVALMPVRGFSSASFTYSAATEANRDGRPLTILYVGDHDPAGLQIDAALQRGLLDHLEVELDFQRVAVTWDQVLDLDLPGTTPKRSYGFPLAVEAEAMPPQLLRDLLHGHLEGLVDQHRVHALEAAEESERLILAELAWGVTT